MNTIIDFLKKQNVNVIYGAEVGVYTGTDAEFFLENIPLMKTMYLIDPYMSYIDYDNIFGKDLMQNPLEAKGMAELKLNKYSNRLKWIIKKFEDCTKEDIIDKLDFIYIDGNHEYKYVKEDIRLSRQFVKKGGVISGHDFQMESIRNAVYDFCGKVDVENDGIFWAFVNKGG